MPKTLKAIRSEKCNGCELCVFEAQRQLKKVGLDGSLIRVFKRKEPQSEYLKYDLEIDPRIKNLNILKIKQICPKYVLEVENEEEEDGNNIKKYPNNRS